MNRLVIIDGNAILHRAYHALPPLTDPEGNVVNAVYGFTTMLLRIFQDLQPTYLAVTFDRPAPTFRKEMFEKYQAHRPKMDDDLIPQVDKVHEVVKAMGIPIFEMDGFEADDVIGTITSKAISDLPLAFSQNQKANSQQQKAKSYQIDQVIIVTGDRDILQLVEEGKVFVYMPTKGLSQSKLYGEKETIERMGVTPKQIPDYKALAGDQSDNYPGVEGIGPKTAASLLKQFNSVDLLYKFIQENRESRIMNHGKEEKPVISETIRKRLIDGKESALMSHTLATIKQDVPIEIELKEIESIDTPEVRDELAKLGFKSIITRMDKIHDIKDANGTKNETNRTNQKEKKEPDGGGQQSLF
jgi:DNA polymerase I